MRRIPAYEQKSRSHAEYRILTRAALVRLREGSRKDKRAALVKTQERYTKKARQCLAFGKLPTKTGNNFTILRLQNYFAK